MLADIDVDDYVVVSEHDTPGSLGEGDTAVAASPEADKPGLDDAAVSPTDEALRAPVVYIVVVTEILVAVFGFVSELLLEIVDQVRSHFISLRQSGRLEWVDKVANWRPATAAGAGALPPAEQEQWTWSEAPRCPICSKEVGRVVGWAAVAVLAVGLAWTKLLW